MVFSVVLTSTHCNLISAITNQKKKVKKKWQENGAINFGGCAGIVIKKLTQLFH